MRIAIFGRVTEKMNFESLRQFLEWLRGSEHSYCLYAPYLEQLMERHPEVDWAKLVPQIFSKKEDVLSCKFVYSLGGDGTVLECVRFLGDSPVPVFGVNFGRLGYLASATHDKIIAATESLAQDMYRIDERRILSVVSEPSGIFGAENFGLNDLTIHKSNTNEMITVHTYLNGEFLNSYRGDGLIIATPTGSTAYSLACGGPIMFPTSGTFLITPIAPHSLTVRSVVVPDQWVISCEIESRSGWAMLALDARTEQVRSGTSIAIKSADFKAKIVRLHENRYINTLRNGLMWGNDARKQE